MQMGQDLLAWKQETSSSGLWNREPVFVTGSLDDAWGHGLAVIEWQDEIR